VTGATTAGGRVPVKNLQSPASRPSVRPALYLPSTLSAQNARAPPIAPPFARPSVRAPRPSTLRAPRSFPSPGRPSTPPVLRWCPLSRCGSPVARPPTHRALTASAIATATTVAPGATPPPMAPVRVTSASATVTVIAATGRSATTATAAAPPAMPRRTVPTRAAALPPLDPAGGATAARAPRLVLTAAMSVSVTEARSALSKEVEGAGGISAARHGEGGSCALGSLVRGVWRDALTVLAIGSGAEEWRSGRGLGGWMRGNE
jgi:hypothetical protein